VSQSGLSTAVVPEKQASNVVPFLDLPGQFRALQDEIDAALKPIFSSAGFIMGPQVAEFEKHFAEYIGVSDCVSLHSGTAALHLALLALGVGPGDEVITAANSFVATTEAIAFVGAKPVLVDADPLTYNIDTTLIEAAITPATKVIMPVHLYGQLANMDAIMRLARKYKLFVVEDACQAHGAQMKGKMAGSYGDLAAFSFYPGKNLGAAGDGGAVVTNNPQLAEKVRLLRDHGSRKKYEHEIVGHNFRLDTIQAAILNIKLKHLNAWNEARMRNAQYYTAALSNVSGLLTPSVTTHSVFHLYVVRVKNRKAVQESMNAGGVQTGIHYPTPIHMQPAFSYLGYGKGDFPVSESAASEILSLPMYAELTQPQMDRVIEALKTAVSL
jgi:dTDP-4-amino-4,6-dideoxygalactose transaminase